MPKPWINNYPEGIKWDSKIEPKPIFEILDYAVDNFPRNTAIDFLNRKYSYSTLGGLVEQAAMAFRREGIKKGTKVGIYLPNCPQFVISYFGILKAGGVVVNCSPLYSENELEFQLDDSETEMLVTLDLKLLYPKAKSILDKSLKKGGKLKKIIVSSLADALPFPKNLLFPIVKKGEIEKPKFSQNIIKWKKFLNECCEIHDKLDENINPDDTAIIQYTGGTTGTPKGAELTHANVYVNTVQSKMWSSIIPDGEGSVLTVLPLFHVFAMTTAMNFGVFTASKLILHPRFELEKVLKDIDTKKPTAMPGVPTMYNAINNYSELDKYDLTSLKVCVSGGGPLPIEVKQKFEDRTGCKLIEGYGLTETSPVAACNPVNGINKTGSIGLPFPQTELLIEDIENRGNFLGEGERGELCIKGPQVMKGYYNRPEATNEVLKDGMLRTGDIAKFDEEGYFYIVDRLKEMIICGGFKVYPRNVEEVIYEHESVLECAVVGIDDDYSGQRVKAFIVLKNGAEQDENEIKRFLNERLARHEVPKIIEFKDELPKSPIGKILKKALT